MRYNNVSTFGSVVATLCLHWCTCVLFSRSAKPTLGCAQWLITLIMSNAPINGMIDRAFIPICGISGSPEIPERGPTNAWVVAARAPATLHFPTEFFWKLGRTV